MIIGQKIYLREVNDSDIETILMIENDSENWTLSGNENSYSRKDIENYISGIKDLYTDRQFRWMICLNENDECIGSIDLFEYSFALNSAGVGITIDKKERKKGYAIEALKMLLSHSFNQLNLARLWASILDHNLQSQKLFEKASFIKIDEKKNHLLIDGEWHNEYIYELVNPNIKK